MPNPKTQDSKAVETAVNQETTEQNTKTEPKIDGLHVRFYENATENPKAPLYRAEVNLPAPLVGMVIEAAVFADRDMRGIVKGFSVRVPGSGRFDVFRPAPVFVQDKDGISYPVKDSRDAMGAAIADSWGPKIVEALYRFQKTGEPVQAILL